MMNGQQKFKINIIDFMLENGKHEVGKDKNGQRLCIGDLVSYNEESNWFIVYRYGEYLLKQVGMMAMIGLKNDFSKVEKLNVFGSGNDWAVIGYTNEPFYEKVRNVEGIQIA